MVSVFGNEDCLMLIGNDVIGGVNSKFEIVG